MVKFCYNCGKLEHNYNMCHAPIMSYGMILYKICNNEPKYLMIQRNYTPDFKEIVRGKFDFNDPEYIIKLISRITLHEINYIQAYPHKILFHNIEKYYKIKKNSQYRDRYKIALDKYTKLIEGHNNIKFSNIVQQCGANFYLEPDWGFPKGKRNYHGNETDLDCAIREVLEETNIKSTEYTLWNDTFVTENYYGTNDINYTHKYYIGECSNNIIYYIDPNNKHQISEIRKIGWFSYNECINLIRPYHKEKMKTLHNVNNILTKRLTR